MDTAEFEYAGFWSRVGASIIDSVLVAMICGPLISWIYGPGGSSGEDVLRAMGSPMELLMLWLRPRGPADVLVSWVMPAVAIVLFWTYRQATPGKMAIRARIVDAASGGPPRTSQLVIRYLGYFVSTVPLGLGLLWVAFDPRKQGWHDKLARTVVVRPKNRGPQPVKFPG